MSPGDKTVDPQLLLRLLLQLFETHKMLNRLPCIICCPIPGPTDLVLDVSSHSLTCSYDPLYRIKQLLGLLCIPTPFGGPLRGPPSSSR